MINVKRPFWDVFSFYVQKTCFRRTDDVHDAMNSCINCLVLTVLFNPSLRRLKDVKTMCCYYYCYCLNIMSQHMSQSSYFTHNTSQRRLLNVQKTSCNHRNSFKNVDDVKLQLFQHITRIKKNKWRPRDIQKTSSNDHWNICVVDYNHYFIIYIIYNNNNKRKHIQQSQQHLQQQHLLLQCCVTQGTCTVAAYLIFVCSVLA